MIRKKMQLITRITIAIGISLSVSSAFAVLSELEKKEIEYRMQFEQAHNQSKQQRLEQVKSNAVNILGHKPPTVEQIQAATTLNSVTNPQTAAINQNSVTTTYPPCKNDCTNPNYRYIYVNNKPFYQIDKSGAECICPNATTTKSPSTTSSSTSTSDTSDNSSLQINYQ